MSNQTSNIVPGLPSLVGVSDTATRNALQSIVDNLRIRNGQTQNDGERFITRNEIGNLTQTELSKLFGVTPGLSGQSQVPTGSTASVLVDNLANAVAQSYLFQRLGERIPILSVPDKIFDKINRIESVSRDNYQSLTTMDEATNQRVTTLAVRVDDAQAGIDSEQTVRAQKDMAIASAVARIWASIGGDPPSNGFAALIQDSQMATATPSAAQATRWTNVQSAVFDPATGQNNIASIQQSFNTYVSAVDGKMDTLYTLQTQLSTGGQTVVGGFGLAGHVGSGNGPTIDFGVRADKFFIAATSSTPDGATQIAQGSTIPFMVITSTQVIGGVTYLPGVYIKNATIANAAIGTANIQAAAITTALIANAAVGTAQIQNAAITNAQIGTAAVSTLSIQGDAVTVPRGAYLATVPFNGYSPISVACPAGAVNAIVSFSFAWLDGSGNATALPVRIYRDGSIIYQASVLPVVQPAGESTSGSAGATVGVTVIDAPSGGGSTYSAEVYYGPSNHGLFLAMTGVSLTVIGCKR